MRTGGHLRHVGTWTATRLRVHKNAPMVHRPARPTRVTTGFRTDVGRDAVASALHGACALHFRSSAKPRARHDGTVSGPPPTTSTMSLAAWLASYIAPLHTCTDRLFVISVICKFYMVKVLNF